jgi:hypothetical protein
MVAGSAVIGSWSAATPLKTTRAKREPSRRSPSSTAILRPRLDGDLATALEPRLRSVGDRHVVGQHAGRPVEQQHHPAGELAHLGLAAHRGPGGGQHQEQPEDQQGRQAPPQVSWPVQCEAVAKSLVDVLPDPFAAAPLPAREPDPEGDPGQRQQEQLGAHEGDHRNGLRRKTPPSARWRANNASAARAGQWPNERRLATVRSSSGALSNRES